MIANKYINLPFYFNQDIAGKVYACLTVIAEGHRRRDNGDSQIIWLCLCECGNVTLCMKQRVLSGGTRSCGCLTRDATFARSFVHGGAARSGKTPTYESWRAMRARCEDSKSLAYERYGGRGITVCERWQLFAHFLADMGERPKGYSIERIDNDGPYTPENCRWGTAVEQGQNKSNTIRLAYQGQECTLRELSLISGLEYRILYERIRKRGWSVEKAVITPLKQDLTTCKRGHLMEGANVYCPPKGGRECRACHKIRIQQQNAHYILEASCSP